MRKAKVEAQSVRQSLICAAEQMLQETNGQRLVMSELASRVGLSQSYAHSFFATKDDLVRELAKRWFEEVERELKQGVDQDETASENLKSYVMTMLKIKRAKFDANQELFRGYLTLASAHSDLVEGHANALRELLEIIVGQMVPLAKLKPACQLVEDATVLFRVPHMIAMFRASATDIRAMAVLEAVLLSLKQINE